jgi:hypothetical protein
MTGLKTGSVLNVTGPKGSRQLTISRGDGYFKTDLKGGVPGGPAAPDYLEPGVYTVDNGSGGSDVGAFRGTLTIPAPLVWTNRESIQTVQRKQDLTVTWSGGDPANQLVLIGGDSSRSELGVRGSFLCMERAGAGRFTVPAMVLSSLPASSPLGEDFPPVVMVGAVSSAEGSQLSAPGVGIARFAYQMITLSLVTFQ